MRIMDNCKVIGKPKAPSSTQPSCSIMQNMSGIELEGSSKEPLGQPKAPIQQLGKDHEESDPLERILQHLGAFGRYQQLLFLAMLPFGFIFASVYFVQMFITPTPQQHWCHVPELAGLDVHLRYNLSAPLLADGSRDRCSTFAANWSQVRATLTPPPAAAPRRPCAHGWDFLLEDIPYHTVVSERGWVCERAGLVPAAQAVFFAGSVLGSLLLGWTADRFGRIPALVAANLVGFAGGVATTFTSGFLDFALSRFLVGMSYDSAFMMIYILVNEYVGPTYRTWVSNMSLALFFGGGCLALPWLALWAADWRRLLLLTSAPMLLVLAAPALLPESARWLASQGRVECAVKVLRRFERINRAEIPEQIVEEFIKKSDHNSIESAEGLGALLRSPPLRLMLLLLVLVYGAVAMIFDGLVRLSEGLGGDLFVTFTLTSATEIPSIALAAVFLDRWGRRNLTCSSMIISGVLAFIGAFVPKGIPQVSLAIMARFCINMSYNGIIQWSTETLPTGVRASGSSLVHVSGYIANILSPYVVYSERVWAPLPLLLLGSTALVAAGAGALLPETSGRDMPQTIADGERLFRERTVCGKAVKGPNKNVEEVYSQFDDRLRY